MRHRLKEIFKKVNARDVVIFVMSLLLASSIWLIHNLSLNYTELVSVPVTAVCNIQGHRGVSSGTSTVLARCRATGFDHIRLGRISEHNPVSVTFSPSDLHPKGGDFYYVTPAEITRHAQEIFGDITRLEAVLTDTLMFQFPLENCRKVPVRAVSTTSFRTQYCAVGELTLTPDSVTVYGDPGVIEEIEYISTSPLRLEDLHEMAHGNVKLEKPSGVRISDESVIYSLGVSRFVELKGNASVESRGVPKNKLLIVYPSSVELTLRCIFPVSGDPISQIQPYVDYSEFSSSLSGKCLIHCDNLPHGVLECRISPMIGECIENSR